MNISYGLPHRDSHSPSFAGKGKMGVKRGSPSPPLPISAPQTTNKPLRTLGLEENKSGKTLLSKLAIFHRSGRHSGSASPENPSQGSSPTGLELRETANEQITSNPKVAKVLGIGKPTGPIPSSLENPRNYLGISPPTTNFDDTRFSVILDEVKGQEAKTKKRGSDQIDSERLLLPTGAYTHDGKRRKSNTGLSINSANDHSESDARESMHLSDGNLSDAPSAPIKRATLNKRTRPLTVAIDSQAPVAAIPKEITGVSPSMAIPTHSYELRSKDRLNEGKAAAATPLAKKNKASTTAISALDVDTPSLNMESPNSSVPNITFTNPLDSHEKKEVLHLASTSRLSDDLHPKKRQSNQHSRMDNLQNNGFEKSLVSLEHTSENMNGFNPPQPVEMTEDVAPFKDSTPENKKITFQTQKTNHLLGELEKKRTRIDRLLGRNKPKPIKPFESPSSTVGRRAIDDTSASLGGNNSQLSYDKEILKHTPHEPYRNLMDVETANRKRDPRSSWYSTISERSPSKTS